MFIPNDVKVILATLKNNGYESYIVGGSVRDSKIGISVPKDYDVTTNALPEEIIKLFGKTIPTGIEHGTVTVMINREAYEVTTYRIDGEYLDNRRPDAVTFVSSLKEDLARRDFTINALAFNEEEGLIDYFGGIEDLDNKIIKAVGEPNKRFQEDALRMLRAIRFSARLGFHIEEKTLEAIKANCQLILNVSNERVRDELCKILISNNVKKGLRLLEETKLLQFILPELQSSVGFNQQNYHHDKDVFEHILAVLENTPAKLEIRLAALLHDIGKPQCFTMDENKVGHFYGHNKKSADISREILKRLKFDNKTIDTVSLLVYEHMSKFDKIKTSSIKKFMSRVGVENLEDLFELQIADLKGSAKEFQDFSKVLDLKYKCQIIIDEKQPLSIKDLNINGSDLIRLGINQGKQIGEALDMLLEMVLEHPELNHKEKLIEIINK